MKHRSAAAMPSRRTWKRRDVLGAMAAVAVLKPGLALSQSQAVTIVDVHPKMAVGSAHLMRRQGRLFFVTAPGQAVQYDMVCDADALAPEGERFVMLLPGSDSIGITDRLSGAPTSLVLAPGKNFSVPEPAFADLVARINAPAPAVMYR